MTTIFLPSPRSTAFQRDLSLSETGVIINSLPFLSAVTRLGRGIKISSRANDLSPFILGTLISPEISWDWGSQCFALLIDLHHFEIAAPRFRLKRDRSRAHPRSMHFARRNNSLTETTISHRWSNQRHSSWQNGHFVMSEKYPWSPSAAPERPFYPRAMSVEKNNNRLIFQSPNYARNRAAARKQRGRDIFPFNGVFSPLSSVPDFPLRYVNHSLAKLPGRSVCDFFLFPIAPQPKRQTEVIHWRAREESIYLICPRFFSVVNIDFWPRHSLSKQRLSLRLMFGVCYPFVVDQ